jgi:hypothetical protein
MVTEEATEPHVCQAHPHNTLPSAEMPLWVAPAARLTPSKDESVRIEACTDLATLERWLDRAVTAVSVADAPA